MILSPHKKTRRAQVKHATPQESKLWSRLKNQALGHRFVRQYAHGPYRVDFCCVEKKLAIDIDGWKRRDNKDHDRDRATYFSDFDYTVLRFWNNEINENLNEVVTKIEKSLQ
ncbi:MAG: DUF559 domain-containing protein [Candidatus Moranbacteria bacterium]|jgi:very-short-patch-repair endonuclease|nr:DUF559 domain-containing protein [Candidatus Moranbacteria bacterium]MBP9801511.1 DUF559 domain-containing protein [Candidatus Moranbacteria bacterium]